MIRQIGNYMVVPATDELNDDMLEVLKKNMAERDLGPSGGMMNEQGWLTWVVQKLDPAKYSLAWKLNVEVPDEEGI